MSKQIFTKTQAIAVLEQIKAQQEINFFAAVEANHAFYKLSCEELENKLAQFIQRETIAGVVEEVEHKGT